MPPVPSRRPAGPKYEKAREWRIPCVNAQWLSDILLGNLEALRQVQGGRYTTFGLPDPFAPAPALVFNLLGEWPGACPSALDLVTMAGLGRLVSLAPPLRALPGPEDPSPAEPHAAPCSAPLAPPPYPQHTFLLPGHRPGPWGARGLPALWGSSPLDAQRRGCWMGSSECRTERLSRDTRLLGE